MGTCQRDSEAVPGATPNIETAMHLFAVLLLYPLLFSSLLDARTFLIKTGGEGIDKGTDTGSLESLKPGEPDEPAEPGEPGEPGEPEESEDMGVIETLNRGLTAAVQNRARRFNRVHRFNRFNRGLTAADVQNRINRGLTKDVQNRINRGLTKAVQNRINRGLTKAVQNRLGFGGCRFGKSDGIHKSCG